MDNFRRNPYLLNSLEEEELLYHYDPISIKVEIYRHIFGMYLAKNNCEGVWPCAHSGKDRFLVRYWRGLRGAGSNPGRDKKIRISVYGLLGDKPLYRHSLDHQDRTIETSERACRGGRGRLPKLL